MMGRFVTDWRARRSLKAVFAAFVALCMNLLPFVPAHAGAFDDVVSVMRVIDQAAPGALPFNADQLIQYRAIIEGCAAASNTDAVLSCIEAAASTDAAQDQGVPSWFPMLIAVYFDIEHHDYWGLLADAGEAVACAGAEVLTGVDVCGAIKTLIEAGKEVYEAGKAAVDAVEDFFSDLGSSLGDLGCDIASIWGGCDNSGPPPPTAATTANGICGPRGGVASMLSPSNAPDNIDFQCNDGTQCRVRPGQPPQCQTPEGKAAAEKQKVAQNTIDFATRPQQWAEQFDARWRPQCPDDQCRVGPNFIKANVLALARQRHAANPDYAWADMGLDLLQADKQAQQIVNEAVTRKMLADSKNWGVNFDAQWLPQCGDDPCRLGIKFVRTGMELHIQQQLSANPALPASALAADYQEAAQQAQQLVAESNSRAANAKITDQASQGWKDLVIGVYSKQCKDLPCLGEINALAKQFRLAIIAQQAKEPNESSLHIQGEVNKVYGPLFKAVVDRSIDRVSRPAPIPITPPPAPIRPPA